MSKKEITYKASLSGAQVAEHLENLKSCFDQGRICLQVGDEHLVLQVDAKQLLEMEISGGRKKHKNKLSFELSWLDMVPQDGTKPSFVISTQEPQAQTPPQTEAAAEPPAPAAAEPVAESQPEPEAKPLAEAKAAPATKAEPAAKAKSASKAKTAKAAPARKKTATKAAPKKAKTSARAKSPKAAK